MIESIARQITALANDRAAERLAFGSTSETNARMLLSPKTVGTMLSNPLVRYPQVRVALDGRAVPSNEYTKSQRIGTRTVNDGVDAAAIAHWLTRGATITIDSLEYLSDGANKICEALSRSLGLPATATAYVTPPGRQGLRPHTDEEDVFILQTFGTKSWIVDAGQRQDVPAAAGFPFNEAMQAVPARLVEPGHMFFMPAGIPHVATAQDCLSIHITFSVERPRVRDVIARKLFSLAESNEELNMLQPWDAPLDRTLSELLSAAESADSGEPAYQEAVCTDLPFTLWENLRSSTVDVLLTSALTVEEADAGYSLRFPTFTMKVGASAGRMLLPLAAGKTVRFALDHDEDLRGILFQLSGRGAAQVRAV